MAKKDKAEKVALAVDRRYNGLWEKWTAIFVMYILAFFPLSIGAQTYYNITLTKWQFFWIGACLYLLGMLVIFAGSLIDKRPLGSIKGAFTPTQIFVAAYMVWGIVSAIASPYPFKDLISGYSRYEGLASLLLYGAVFLCISRFGKWSDKIVTGVAIMGIIAGGIGMIQLLGGTMLYPGEYTFATSHFVSTMGNIDCMSGLVAMAVPFLACSYVLVENSKPYLLIPSAMLLLANELYVGVDSGKMGILAAAFVVMPFLVDTRKRAIRTLIMAAALLATFAWCALLTVNWWSNTAWHWRDRKMLLLFAAALLCAGVAFALSKMKTKVQLTEEEQTGRAKKVRIIVLIAMCIIALAAIAFVYSYRGEVNLLRQAHDFLHGELADSAGNDRGAVWKQTVEMVKNQRTLIGGGPGSYYDYYMSYDATHAHHHTTIAYDFAHNDFLQIAACQGLIGLALYLAALVSIVIRTYRTAGNTPQAAILGAAVAACLGHLFFSFSIAFFAPIYWVLLGLLDAVTRQALPERLQKRAEPKTAE